MADSDIITFYPEISPFNKGELKVGSYTLPYQEFGNPDGIPVVFLHGGPGLGLSPDKAQSYDPAVFRIVLYDQRGAGTSVPVGGLKNNTPDLLVDDLEELKNHLGLDKWHVQGGSWGSTLALLYAQKYPESVQSLTIWGIYLLRIKEGDLSHQAVEKAQPETMKRYREFLPEQERHDLSEAYYQRLFNPDAAVHMPAAREIARLGMSIYSIDPTPPEWLDDFDPDELESMRIEWSIIRNHKFVPEDKLLRDIDKIRHIPTMIIQGRQDLICPPQTALDLHQAFPEAQLQLVNAGHSSSNPEMSLARAQATKRISETGSPMQNVKPQVQPRRDKRGPGIK